MNTRSSVLFASIALGLMGSVACDYEAPINDQYQNSNTISGTIVASGVTEPGLVFVFVFDAKNPPPPVGTGSPVTFSAVPSSAFTGDQAGVQSAPYAIPYLPDTTEATGFEAGFLVTALMDTDHNFNPFADALGGSTCTDWLGEHRDQDAARPAQVFVEGGELKDNVTITINRQNLTQRPAFTLKNKNLRISKQTAAASLLDQASNTQFYRVLATGVHTNYPGECPKGEACPGVDLDLEGPCTQDPALTDQQCAQQPACYCPPAIQDPCQTGFMVHMVDNFDADGNPTPDGVHDPYPAELQAANDLKDTWPRLFLEYQGTLGDDGAGNTVFQNDLGTFEWPPGTGRMVNERWVAENYPLALELNFLGPSLVAPAGEDPYAPFLAKELNMTFSPAFRHYHEGGTFDVDPANGPWDLYDLRCYADPAFGDGQFPSNDEFEKHPATCVPGQPVSVDDVPSGVWRMTMVTEAGQTWRLPNEIGLPAWAEGIGVEQPLESTDPTFDVTDQGVYMIIE